LDFLDAQDSQFARAARQDSVQRQRLAGCREGSSESGVAQASARPATAAQAASQPAVVAPAKTAQAKAGDQAAAKAADAYDLAAINKEIDALPYDASVKSDLKLMAKYGDPADVRQTLATLKTYKPKIEFSPSDLWSCGGGSCGWSYAQTFGHQKIQVNPGYVLSKDGWQFPISSVKYKEVAAAEHYSSTAPLAVTDPNNKKRKDLGMVDGTHEYLYPDGSKLVMYSDASVAGTMMHEINHVKRDGEGGGTNGYSNELDAHDIQYRFYTRYEEKSSGKISLDLWKSSMLDEWQVDPKRFSDDLIDRYIANGEIKSTGETTIEQQKAAAQKRLDAAQKIAADPKASKKDRDAALQTVQAEKRELAGLAKDATLHVTEEQYQEQWRADVESSFRAWVASDAAKQRQQVQSAKMTKAARAKALADLQQRSQDELSIPWEYIPCWDGATMASGCPKP
ncbi:MAG: hypothetical protein NTX64_04640, partial [Elusimicrobia bacterium]|nr:hypothetical protein [Elusimicrobiota bacterium]